MDQERQPDFERAEEEAPADFPRISDKLTDLKQLGRFNYQLRSSSTIEEKLSDLQVLSNTPSAIIYKFLSSPGLRTIGEWVFEGSSDISKNAQVLGKIFSILKEVQIRSEYLDSAQYLGLGIEKLQIALASVEENETRDQISNVFSKYYHLNKAVINEWLESFRRKLTDPQFKKQALSSEQAKKRQHFNKDYNNNNKSSYNNSSNNTTYSRDSKSNSFKPNGGSTGTSTSSSSSRFNRADSPPTSKKQKFNNNPTSFYSSQTPSFPKDQRRKQIQFSGDNQVKRFRKEDEPVAEDLTDLEVEMYQEECKKKRESSGQLFVNAQDMRSRENKLEKDNLFQIKETEKKERQQLDAMKEDIPWRTPPRLKELGAKYLSQVSTDSIEKEIHKKRILCKMQSLYGGDNEIPDMPSYENVINDKASTQEPLKIYLNKLDEQDFIQVIEMAIKSQGKDQKIVVEKKPLKSILKRPKEEKDRLRKKMLEEKRKTMDEEERMKKNINPIVVQKLLDLIKQNKNNSKDELISTVKSLGLSEKELHNIYQNFNIITQVLQRENISELQAKDLPIKHPQIQAPQSKPEYSQMPVPLPATIYNNPPPVTTPLPPLRNNGNMNNPNIIPQQTYNTYRQQQVPINTANNFSSYPSQQPPPPSQQPLASNTQNWNGNKLNKQVLPNSFSQRFPSTGTNNNNANSSNSFQPSSGVQSYSQQGYPQQSQSGYAPFQPLPPSSANPGANFSAGANNSAFKAQQNYRPNGQNNIYNNGNQLNSQQPQGQPFNRASSNGDSLTGNFNPTKAFQTNNSYNNSSYNPAQQQQQQQAFSSSSNASSQSQLPSAPSSSMMNQQYQSNKTTNISQAELKSPAQSTQSQYVASSSIANYTTSNILQSSQPQTQQLNQQSSSSSSSANPQQQQQSKPAGSNNNNNNNNMSGFSMLPVGDERERNIPCRMYHSEMGCHRDLCYFQHIPQYQGRAAPNMHKLVRPMHALSKNTERNLENTFAYNRAKFEKKSNQLGALPFPVQGQTQQQAGAAGAGGYAYPSTNSNSYQNNSSSNNINTNNQGSFAGNSNPNSNSSSLNGFPFGQQNPLLKQQQQQQNQYKQQQNSSSLM